MLANCCIWAFVHQSKYTVYELLWHKEIVDFRSSNSFFVHIKDNIPQTRAAWFYAQFSDITSPHVLYFPNNFECMQCVSLFQDCEKLSSVSRHCNKQPSSHALQIRAVSRSTQSPILCGMIK